MKNKQYYVFKRTTDYQIGYGWVEVSKFWYYIYKLIGSETIKI